MLMRTCAYPASPSQPCYRRQPASRCIPPIPQKALAAVTISRTVCRSSASESNGELSSSDREAQELEGKQGLSDAITRSLSELARSNGRRGNSTNLVLVDDASEETWRKLDKKVNKYPGQREFKAIGTGGQAFQARMLAAVSKVVPVHQECVSSRLSSQGSYLSVTIGPVWVEQPDQVIEIYTLMKAEGGSDLRYLI